MQNSNGALKRKHDVETVEMSNINQDVHNFATNYEALSFFEECAVCGIEDKCDDKVCDIGVESLAIIKDAFLALIDRSENSLFVEDICNTMQDGFLKDRVKLCR